MKRKPYALMLLSVMLIPACSSETATPPETAMSATDIEQTKPTAEELAAKAEAEKLRLEEAAEAEAARILKESQGKLAALEEGFEEALNKYRTDFSNAKTSEARRALVNPATEFGPKFLQLATDYPDTDVAEQALETLLKRGTGDAKSEAMNLVLAKAEKDVESEYAVDAFNTLFRYGSGEVKTKSMGHMLTRAEKDLESEDAVGILTKLVRVRGESETKTVAIGHLVTMADSDIESEKAVDCLVTLAGSDDKEASNSSLDKLLKHHVNHSKLVPVINQQPRKISARTEAWLNAVYENSTDAVKANAIVALSKFSSTRDLYREYYAGASEEERKQAGEELIAYLETDVDPQSAAKLEAMLQTYVSNHEAVLESAKGELFVRQKLAIGKVAPEIIGNDFDGTEFKLTDYRGKVVFLDFWGDW